MEHSIYLLYIEAKGGEMDLVWNADRRATLVTWPTTVDDRLDLLVRAATAAGESVNRSQLLAALVAEASQDPDQLSSVIRRYRTTESDRFVAAHVRADLPVVRKPGRRRKRVDPAESPGVE
jgi:hypothetical protein